MIHSLFGLKSRGGAGGRAPDKHLMQYVDITIEDPRWGGIEFEALALRAIAETLAHLGFDSGIAEVSLLACDDNRITELNADFRAKPTPTNVLSWPSEERGAEGAGQTPFSPEPGLDGLLELGDIAISYDTCAAEARAADKPITDHVTHLLVHGSLHLLGYDHENEKDASLMEGLEVKILGKLGLDDPYRIL